MYQEERIFRIYERLKERKTLTNQDIMEEFHVSRDTARRDILKLVQEGKALRTHGGITLFSIHEIDVYHVRENQNVRIKKQLAKQAIRYLTMHKVCFFDVSTTVANICELVSNNIEAYSHSIANVEILSKHCATYMIGGKYNPTNRFMYGSQTMNVLDSIYFDFAYIGAAGILEDGIYVEDYEDAAIKKKVAQRCGCICLVVDSSKFSKKSTYRALKWEDIHIIITDTMPPEHILKEIKKAGSMIDTKT